MVTLELVLGSIGTIGAGLSAILTFLKIKEYFDNKPKISLEIKSSEIDSIEKRENYNPIIVKVDCDVMNSGNRTTTIRSVYLTSVNLKGNLFYAQNASCTDIEAGKSVNFKLSFSLEGKELIDKLRHMYDSPETKQLLFYVNFIDTTNKRVRKEIIQLSDTTFGLVGEKPMFDDEMLPRPKN